MLINEDSFDYMPHYDNPITESERRHIEDQVRLELERNGMNQQTGFHPLVDRVLPLGAYRNGSSNSSLSMTEELESCEANYNEDDSYGGIDASKYDINGNMDNEQNLTTLLSYSVLQQRELDLERECEQEVRYSNVQSCNAYNNMELLYTNSVKKKRKLVEEVEENRKKKQVQEFGPERTFLDDSWKELMRNNLHRNVSKLSEETTGRKD